MKGVLFVLLTFIAFAQSSDAQINYISNDNYTGTWLDDDSWAAVAAWAPQNPSEPTNSNATTVTVNGYITRAGDLTMSGTSTVITVIDTLVILGT